MIYDVLTRHDFTVFSLLTITLAAFATDAVVIVVLVVVGHKSNKNIFTTCIQNEIYIK